MDIYYMDTQLDSHFLKEGVVLTCKYLDNRVLYSLWKQVLIFYAVLFLKYIFTPENLVVIFTEFQMPTGKSI